MNNINICPRCTGNISDERAHEMVVICPHCGWVREGQGEAVEEKMQRSISYALMAICALMVSSFIMVVNWDHHAVAIVPLKVKQWSGIATHADLHKIATICQERGKPHCIEEAYSQVVAKWPEDTKALSYYAKILAFNGKTEKSIEAFEQFFVDGKKDADLAYDFAKVLTENGQTKKAVQYYEIALRGKPGVLQVTVLKNYVSFLIEQGEFHRAKRVIMKTRRIGINSRNFMEQELSEIKQSLRSA